jgi:hypothetical protein
LTRFLLTRMIGMAAASAIILAAWELIYALDGYVGDATSVVLGVGIGAIVGVEVNKAA